jgi:hypothetical protein
MRKLGFICLALLLAAGALGVVYSSWSQNLNTSATVSIAPAPAVVASGANAGTSSATLNGSLTQTAPGNAAVSVGFKYWPDSNPSNIMTVSAGSVSSLNSIFSTTVTGLTPGVTYDYQSTGVGFFTVNSINTSTFITNSTLAVTTSSLPGGTVGVPYSQTLQASGGSGSYTSWTLSGSLPAGLSLHNGNIISGTPTTIGSYSFTVQVKDGSNPPQTATSSSLTIVISNAPSKLAFGQQPTSTTPGTAFNPNVTVNIEDSNSNIVTTSSAAVSIILNAPSSGGPGTLSGMQTVNAVNGVAIFNNLSIDKAGTGYTLTASSAGLTGATSSSFDITARTTNQLSLETASDGSGILISAQSLTAGAGGSVTVYAIERDASGIFIANVAGTWSLANITGGLVSSELIPSGDSKSAVFTASNLAGSATIHVVWDGMSADSGTITVIAGTATKLIFTTQPGASSLGGVAFTTQPVVTVEDANNNPVTSPSVSITLAIGTNPSGGTLTISGGNPVSSTNGVAAFSGVSIDKVGSGYTLTATGGSLTPATSNTFNITVSADYNLVFTQQPSGGAASSSFTTQPQVTVKDAGGNIVTTYNGTVKIAITGTPPSGTILSATTNPLTVVSGVATFSGVSINWAGTYTLTATSGNLTAPSSSFTVTAIPRTYTGTGTNDNFSQADHWTGGSVPGPGDSIIILNTCNFDNTANNFVYGALTPGNGSTTGTLQWPASGTNTLQVTNISAANTYGTSQILMTGTGSSGTLQISGTWTMTHISFTAGTGTVNYSGAAQNVAALTYNNLTLSGSGVKTLGIAMTTIGGNLTLSGTATATTVVGLTISGNLSIGTGTTFTAGGFPLTITGKTTVGSGTSGTLTISSATGTKTFTGAVTINIGSTWNNSGNSPVEFQGGITNSGTFTAGSGIYTFDTNSQALTGTLSIPSVTVTGVTLTNNGTLTLTTALTGSGTLANTGTLNINFTGTVGITTITATASGNTINYGYAGTQTIYPINYSNLTLSGSGAKTLQTGTTTITGNLTLNGTASTTSVTGLTIGGTVTLGSGTAFTAGAFTHNVAGNWTNNGTTFTNTSSTVNFNGIAQTIGGSAATTFNNVNISGTNTSTGVATIISGTLIVGDGSTFTAAGFALTVTGTTTVGTGTGGTLTISSVTGTKTFTGAVTINSGGAITESAAAAATLSFGSDVTINTNGTLTENGTAVVGIAGSFTDNGTYTASTGVHTFSGATKTIGGSTSTSIPNATITGTYTNNGTLTIGTALSGAGTLTNSATGTFNIGGTCSVTTISNAGNMTINGSGALTTAAANFSNTGTLNLNGSGAITGITNNASGTININASPVPAITTLTATAVGNTVNYSGTGAQTVKNVNYYNLTFSGARNTNSITINGAVGVAGALTNGASFSSPGNFVLAGSTFTFNGTGAQTVISLNNVTYPILTINKASGTATLGSAVTATTFNITAGTFDPSTYKLTATTPTFTSGTLRVGAATWGGNYSFAVAEPILGTIEYYATSDQTVNPVAYGGNLILDGGGAKSMSAITSVAGKMTITSQASIATGVGINVRALFFGGANQAVGTWGYSGQTNNNQTYFANTTGYLTVAAVSPITSTAAGGTWAATGTWVGGVAPNGNDDVVIATTAVNSVTLGVALTQYGTLTINNGASLAMSTFLLTLNSDLINNGGTTSGSGGVTIAGTAPQNIGSFTTTGTVSMTKTAGTATFTGNVNGAALTINGSGGTLNLGAGLTHQFNGVVTLTAGTLNGGSSTLNENATSATAWNGTGSVFTAGTGTVNFGAAGNQTLSASATTFNNLTISGSGAKTLGATTTINGNLTLSGTATATTGANLAISGSLTVSTGTTFTFGANYILGVTGTTSITGTYTDNSTGAKTLTGDVTISSGGVWSETAVSTYSIAGNFTNNATTFTATTGIHTFSGTGKTISGSTTISIPNVAITGTVTNSGTLTVTTALTGAGTLTNGDGTTGTLNIGGTSAITTLIATAAGNTVNYNSTGAQTVKNVNYYNLTFSGARNTNSITINGAVGVAGALTNGASFSSPGNFVLTGSTFTFNGTGAQTVISLNSVAYVNLTLSGTGAKTTAGITVNGIFTMGGDATVAVSDTPNYGAVATLQYSKTAPFAAGIEWPATFNGTGGVIIGGAGAITTNAAMTLGNIPLTVNAGATLATASTYTLTVGGTTSVSGTLTIADTGPDTFTGAVTINAGGALTENMSATLSFGSNVTINTGGTLTENGAAIVGIAGNLTNNGTYTASTGVHTFSGSGKTIGGTTTNTILSATFSGTYTNSGTLTSVTSLIVTGAFTNSSIINAYTLTITGVTLTNNGTITATNALSGTGTLTNGATGTLNFGGASITPTLTATAAGNTVNYTGTGQTLKVTSYSNLTLSGGAETFGAITTIGANLTLSGTAAATTGAALTIGGNLTVGAGTTFATGATNTWTLGVTGTTSVTGTLTLANTGAKTFTGDVTVNSGGVWNETGIAAVNFAGSLTNNGTTFTANTGVHTFSGSGMTIGGTTATSIPNVTISGSYTINGTPAVTTALVITGTANLNVPFHAATLKLGATSEPNGTYGSTGSGATNQSSTYFGTTATGILTVP